MIACLIFIIFVISIIFHSHPYSLSTNIFYSAIGPIIGGIIASITGYFFLILSENSKLKDRRKIAARAFLMEISKYQEFIGKILEKRDSFSNAEWGLNLGRGILSSNYQQFETWILQRIHSILLDSGIVVSGPNSALISKISPFETYYSDMFLFDDMKMVEKLKTYYECLVAADGYFKNFEGPNRIDADLLRAIEQLERANDIIQRNGLCAYLNKFK